MQNLHTIEKKMDDKDSMQGLLHTFVLSWKNETDILASLTDDNHAFISELNTFFVRGYVKYPSDSKTLFPIFRP